MNNVFEHSVPHYLEECFPITEKLHIESIENFRKLCTKVIETKILNLAMRT